MHEQSLAVLGNSLSSTVVYDDRTRKKTSFNKENTFGFGFGRILFGETSESAPQPAEDRPEDRV